MEVEEQREGERVSVGVSSMISWNALRSGLPNGKVLRPLGLSECAFEAISGPTVGDIPLLLWRKEEKM